MPLKLNAGLSRKVADGNYGSRGASVNIELELDSGLVDDPPKLREKVHKLFNVIRTSVDEELNGHGHGKPAEQPSATGNNGASPPAKQPRPATESQVKAIHAIARSRHINVAQFLKERFQVSRPDELSIKTASQAIDELKNGEDQGG
jgi:hypothetical protein